mmetsp:Transcript_20013/g.46179  ORF Transcript_20013/g.46179 Transcript_20013/m.46179 type:complete len:260 (+) Transcript_20013:238-1017(+)
MLLAVSEDPNALYVMPPSVICRATFKRFGLHGSQRSGSPHRVGPMRARHYMGGQKPIKSQYCWATLSIQYRFTQRQALTWSSNSNSQRTQARPAVHSPMEWGAATPAGTKLHARASVTLSLQPQSFALMAVTHSAGVVIDSASSSGISMSNASSMAMMSSTASSESAPRSSVKEASGVTEAMSTPSCSAMIDFTLSSTSSIVITAAATRERLVGGAAAEAHGTNELRPSSEAAGALNAAHTVAKSTTRADTERMVCRDC